MATSVHTDGQKIDLTAGDLVKGAVRLLSPPEVLLRLNALLEDSECPASTIGQVIGRDPVLTARLLRLANSPFYGFPSRIDTVSRAITVIGINALRNLVLVTSAVSSLSGLPAPRMQEYWQHSLRAGIIARTLAVHCRMPEPEALFAVGLLHDIGVQIIAAKLPEIARELHCRACDTGRPIAEVEREVLGFDHAEVGAELLLAWRLPRTLIEPVAWHHRPLAAGDMQLAALIVNAADIIAHELKTAGGETAMPAVLARLPAAATEILQTDAGLFTRIEEDLERNGAPLARILLELA
jgi:putative nucleotidyltransferase with HDIG domain